FGKWLRALRIHGRKGLAFSTLRHTFRTVADEAKDQQAVDFLMGHEVPNTSSRCRQTLSNERLRAVTDHVRHWLFGEEPNAVAPTMTYPNLDFQLPAAWLREFELGRVEELIGRRFACGQILQR